MFMGRKAQCGQGLNSPHFNVYYKCSPNPGEGLLKQTGHIDSEILLET